MLSCVDDLGTGRIRLPLEHIQKLNVTYGQPVFAECDLNGVKHKFLCTASVLTPPSSSSAAASFDPTVQCSLQTEPLHVDQNSLLLLSVKPVTSKVTTATSIQVLVPDHLLASAVPAAHLQQRLLQKGCTVHLAPSVFCHVLDIIPAGPSSAVYRVVPSTSIQLVSSSSSSARNSKAAETTAAGSAGAPVPTAFAVTACGSSSSAGSSRPKSSKGSNRSSSSTAGDGRPNSSSSSKSSSSKSAKDKKKKSSKKAPGSPIAASGSMFDLLDALADD